MKEEEFEREYSEESIEIPIYYGVDEKEEVILDEESIQEEFENKLDDIRNFLKKDKLQRIVAEKIRKDENKKSTI